MAISPITSIDSPNIVATTTTNVYNITGSEVGQPDVDYLLAPKYSFTGSLIQANNEVGFGYGVLLTPTGSSLRYSNTNLQDFTFFVNGVRIFDSEVISFTSNFINTETTLSVNLGYPLIDSDVITAVGKFHVPAPTIYELTDESGNVFITENSATSDPGLIVLVSTN